MGKRRNTAFLKGTLALSISVIVTKLIGVGFKVPLSYILGDAGMGYFNTAYAIYGFFYILCTAGVPKAMTLILRSNDNGYSESYNSIYVLKCALRLFFIVGTIATLINIICAPALVNLVGNKKALSSVIAIAPSILFVSLSGVLRGYLNSYERLTQIAVSQLLEGMIKLFFGLALAFLGAYKNMQVSSISALAITGITLGSAVSCLYMIITVFFSNKIHKNKQNIFFNRKDIRIKLLKTALPIALCSSLLNLSSTLDLTIIIKRLIKSGYSEFYANSLYGNYTTLAIPMFTLVIAVLSPLATSYMPRLSSLAAVGNTRKYTSELRTLLTVTVLISVPASLAFYFYSFDLLDVLFSVQSSALGADMLMCLSLGVCFLSALTVINTGLESRSRIGITVVSLLMGAFVKIAVSYMLIGNPVVGMMGAPIGTVISYAVSLFISLFALELSGIKTHTLGVLSATYLIGAVSFYFPYKLIYLTAFTGSSFVAMSVSLLISGLLYGAVIFFIYIVQRRRMFNLHKKVADQL